MRILIAFLLVVSAPLVLSGCSDPKGPQNAADRGNNDMKQMQSIYSELNSKGINLFNTSVSQNALAWKTPVEVQDIHTLLQQFISHGNSYLDASRRPGVTGATQAGRDSVARGISLASELDATASRILELGPKYQRKQNHDFTRDHNREDDSSTIQSEGHRIHRPVSLPEEESLMTSDFLQQ
jgi:hypothetical protein